MMEMERALWLPGITNERGDGDYERPTLGEIHARPGLCLDLINISILVVRPYYIFLSNYYWGKLGKEHSGSLDYFLKLHVRGTATVAWQVKPLPTTCTFHIGTSLYTRYTTYNKAPC